MHPRRPTWQFRNTRHLSLFHCGETPALLLPSFLLHLSCHPTQVKGMSSSTPPIAIPKGSSSGHPSTTMPSSAAGAAAASDRDHLHEGGHHLSQQPPLKLQTRRGSRSAPDPWALGPLSSPSMSSLMAADHASSTSGYPNTASGPNPTASTSNPATTGHITGSISFPSSGASRLTIVRVHDDNADGAPGNGGGGGGDLSDGIAASFGVNPVIGSGTPRPGRSNSWGSNYSSGSNASAGVTSGAGTAGGGGSGPGSRSHSPGGTRRPGGMFPK